MKRLFIALSLPEDIRSTVAQFLEPYKTHTAFNDAKWVPVENQHLTVLFLGDVPDPLVPEITELTRGVCGRMQPFSLVRGRVTLFPSDHAKMLWLRYDKSLAFEELVGELRRYLLLALPKLEEEKSPLPHVTLARLREPVNPKTLTFKPLELPPLNFNTITLYESVLRPEGAVYTVIETFPYGF